jgi:hypothetical protein
VHERDGLPGAAREIADRAQPPFLQIRKDPFGFRHAEGIFFR